MIGQVITVNSSTTEHDEIVSPHYPKVYHNNVYCQWTIQADQGMLVQLSFVEIDLEDGYALIRIFIVSQNGLLLQ